ncbi:hypothetical protein GLYMA_17G179000v4 [Glycine max]|uniref:Secreted protein n=1 Tax=Glycine max TaxID=3847 RepID=K7MMA0_SOYBN|nr:hypothetical protein JHK86_047795 [Glycine max]KAG4933605.1 hypothetical protein JHK87_047607 [Glycine soja]KAG4943766.1 hypothetical protein JHK85_048412 [Glycine max]KAG5102846.1 hypothetical protein JHK84_047815 [Glycine max]KAH1118954.1 hypothetical protein GYH30_047652 [Glycine max]
MLALVLQFGVLFLSSVEMCRSCSQSSLHCFEGLEWLHLKRGRKQFARGLVVKVDPQGRCGGVLIYGLQMIILKATQVYPLLANLKFFVVYGTTYFLCNLFIKKNH